VKNISVRVKLAASLAVLAGYREKNIDLPEGSTVRDAIQSAGFSEKIAKICAGQMNGLPVDDASVLRENDRLLLYMKAVVRGG
jgi:sulfur carrier protein ThiS